VTVNRVRSWRQSRARWPAAGFDPTDQFLTQLEDPASDLSVQWDRDHDRHVFDKLLAVARVGCEPATWEAFQLFAIEGRPAAEVAARTGLTENAVVLAKSRLLRRLRQEAAGLID
jgi:RNA polymerase sigma-70 factor (ECF subfamily)